MIGRVRYIGNNYGFSLINGEVYDCIAIEDGMLRIIDNECKNNDAEYAKEGYLYSITKPGTMDSESDGRGIWLIVSDPEGKLKSVLGNVYETDPMVLSEEMNRERFIMHPHEIELLDDDGKVIPQDKVKKHIEKKRQEQIEILKNPKIRFLFAGSIVKLKGVDAPVYITSFFHKQDEIIYHYAGYVPSDKETSIYFNHEQIESIIRDEELIQYPPPCMYIERARTGASKRLKTTEFVIGRNENADFYIRDNRSVSRIAAKIHYSKGKYYVQNIGATNRVFVNDIELQQFCSSDLSEKTRLRIADEDFTFYINEGNEDNKKPIDSDEKNGEDARALPTNRGKKANKRGLFGVQTGTLTKSKLKKTKCSTCGYKVKMKDLHEHCPQCGCRLRYCRFCGGTLGDRVFERYYYMVNGLTYDDWNVVACMDCGMPNKPDESRIHREKPLYWNAFPDIVAYESPSYGIGGSGNNNYYKQHEPVWGAWQIGNQLGEGVSGKVFELSHNAFGRTFYAALKAITIPYSQREIHIALSDGMDKADIIAYHKGAVDDIINKIVLISEMRGNRYVVSYQDHLVVEHETGIGWDILIRMERLSTLDEYVKSNRFTRTDIIRLGIDVCKALELCLEHGIIHGNIKPENILVSLAGDFKVGDFGIARIVNRNSDNHRKGTYSFMAPEVYRGESYGTSADTYSLGLVLYRLLNYNRLPFLPAYPTPVLYQDFESAMMQRMNGEVPPAPKNADERLAEIVLKSCRFEPEQRYSNPAQMRQELERLM